ncbi:MAG: flagellar hook-associated protein FlgK, partial [Planctomycetota bacterium]
MNSFDIGISGLKAAREAIGIVGNNIANAATDGYHRQRIELAPAYASQVGTVLLGGGVDVIGFTRMIDGLLEKEILRQQSLLEQTSQELATLRTVESMFAELSGVTGLSAAIDDFFNALQDLGAHPGEAIWQNQAVAAAETMAAQFRMLGDFLDKLQAQLRLEAENTVEQINALTGQIAELNKKIVKIEIDGGQANNLCDQRDQRISELSELVGLEIQQREYGAVDVSISGIPVVANTTTIALEADLTAGGCIGISVAGESNYKTSIQGGRL